MSARLKVKISRMSHNIETAVCRGYAVVASPAMPAAGGMTTPAAAPFGPAETLQPPETDGQPFVPSDHLPQWVSNDRKVMVAGRTQWIGRRHRADSLLPAGRQCR